MAGREVREYTNLSDPKGWPHHSLSLSLFVFLSVSFCLCYVRILGLRSGLLWSCLLCRAWPLRMRFSLCLRRDVVHVRLEEYWVLFERRKKKTTEDVEDDEVYENLEEVNVTEKRRPSRHIVNMRKRRR